MSRKLLWRSSTVATIFTYTNMKKAAPDTRRIDLMFRAFSDRTRLRILQLLRGRELCVGDLVSILRVPQPTASRHLAYLRKAGLVVVRKAGLWSYYSLSPAESSFHGKLLDCLGGCFAEVPEIKADAARAAKIKNTGGCCPEEGGGQGGNAKEGKDVGDDQ